MSAPRSDVTPGEHFVRFWSAPSDGSAASLFRIAYGLLATWTAVGVFLNLDRYYGYRGLVPWEVVQGFPEQRYSLLALAPESSAWLGAIAAAFLAGALMVTVGAWPRLGALLIYATNVGLQHRNPYVLNNGDRLFVILAALAVFLPWGARYSVDAWRRARRGLPELRGHVWAQRLIALQVSYIYLSSCFAKLRYAEWREGTAVRDVLSSPVFSEWPMRVEFTPLVQFLTWSTLAFELLFPILVWNPRFRPYLLAAGLLFHAGIEVTMTIPMFSAVMITTYACFLSDGEAHALVAKSKRAVERLFSRRERGRAARAVPEP
jgi:hypothetical protein